MMHDENPATGAPDSSFETIQFDNLVNITNEAQASSEDLDAKKGWVIRLEEGEKSLSSVVTINGDLLATTFKPTNDASYDGCGVPSAEKRLYALNVVNGGPPTNANSAEFNTTLAPRYIPIEVGGIPPEPFSLFLEGSDTIDIYVDNEKQLELDQVMHTVFWYEK